MIIWQQWNHKTNSRLLKAHGVASLCLLILIIAGNADARDIFSKQYGLPCEQCHTKIPNLREFGQNFKNNGFSLEKRVANPRNASGESAAPAAPQSSSAANALENDNEMSKADSSLKTPPGQPS